MKRILKAWIIILVGSYVASSCNQKKKLFTLLDSDNTSVTFSNRIIENDSINIIDNEYVYNGGGVAIGDFNNDGLQDVYLTGNMVSNKLYLNKGDMKFQDITETSGVNGNGMWCSGIALVDINNDGLLDMYVCATLKKDAAARINLLYINQGNNKDGIPRFKEMAVQYGVADTTYSTNAAFFDYDRDGDLDLFVLVDRLDPDHYPNKYHTIITDGSGSSTNRLYKNDWSDSLKHPVFTDVSKQAGISTEGFGLGVHIADINRDGWPDIYVTNDYISNDLLYINNKNGTFTNKAFQYLKHTSFSAMGNDIADINNDGLQDIIAVDMLPGDNYRKKMMLNPNNYSSYLNLREFGYQYQYVRNTLQLNMGDSPGPDSLRHPLFGDIAYYSGVSSTDWSWAPLVADFDNDGYRDIIITNGFPRDVTDHDFIAYRTNTRNYAPKDMILEQIPMIKLTNYAYKNNGDLTFTDVSKNWGIELPTFSNGAAYADLDNDGDLDYIVNNIDDSAHVYRNNLNELHTNNNYLRIKLEGDHDNLTGIGSLIEIKYGKDKKQVHEQTPYRGYLSTMESIAHFGLGTNTLINNIKVTWPDGKIEVLNNVKANQVLTVDKTKADLFSETITASKEYLLKDITDSLHLDYVHQDKDYVDFNVQKLLPHKFSQYGPAIAVGDANGDNLDDFFVGGSYGNSGKFFLQQPNGKFTQKDLEPSASMDTKPREDASVLLFDADKDGDLDLYIASGGYENNEGSDNYKDCFYLNDGKGNFTLDNTAFPFSKISKSCVRAIDFDKDGDLDLFVGGRVMPEKYPMPVTSFVYRNDTKNGKVQFTDVTSLIAPALANIGLVCDMLWTDIDNDGWPDMMLAGEWMPLTILKNNKGKFEKLTDTGLQNFAGWWNSLTAGDFDNDGDIDYIAGNVGLNTFYKATETYPAKIYASDYNKDGGYDAIPTLFLPDTKGKLKEFPAFGRDDMIKQMIAFKARFTNYKKYALSGISEVLTKEEIEQSIKLQATNLASCYIKNTGNGKFEMTQLPVQAQLSSIFGMLATDVDGDGNLDVIMNGNDYSTEIATGYYDALNGLVLKGDGKGNFTSIPAGQSGLYIPGDGKALVTFRSAMGQQLLIATQNQGPLAVFKEQHSNKLIPLKPTDISIEYVYTNGTKRKEELFFGNSFYSQSGRYAVANPSIKSITVTDYTGKKRELNP